MTKDELVYVIPAGQYGKEGVLALLEQHPEIKFVSLVGIDLAGNDTDEKIPISVFFDDYDKFFNATAFQTDGSSVVLPGIAILSNARVDIKADPSVSWFVDYNDDNIDPETGKPVGLCVFPASFVMPRATSTPGQSSAIPATTSATRSWRWSNSMACPVHRSTSMTSKKSSSRRQRNWNSGSRRRART